jgi:hypothetical protein
MKNIRAYKDRVIPPMPFAPMEGPIKPRPNKQRSARN